MSRSARRKSIKQLDLERKQLRRRADADRRLLIREAAAFMAQHRRELDELRETFGPCLQKLVSVTIGVPLNVISLGSTLLPRDASDERKVVFPRADIYQVQTSQDLEVAIRLGPELVRFAFPDHWEIAVRECSRDRRRSPKHLADMPKLWNGGEGKQARREI